MHLITKNDFVSCKKKKNSRCDIEGLVLSIKFDTIEVVITQNCLLFTNWLFLKFSIRCIRYISM